MLGHVQCAEPPRLRKMSALYTPPRPSNDSDDLPPTFSLSTLPYTFVDFLGGVLPGGLELKLYVVPPRYIPTKSGSECMSTLSDRISLPREGNARPPRVPCGAGVRCNGRRDTGPALPGGSFLSGGNRDNSHNMWAPEVCDGVTVVYAVWVVFRFV